MPWTHLQYCIKRKFLRWFAKMKIKIAVKATITLSFLVQHIAKKGAARMHYTLLTCVVFDSDLSPPHVKHWCLFAIGPGYWKTRAVINWNKSGNYVSLVKMDFTAREVALPTWTHSVQTKNKECKQNSHLRNLWSGVPRGCWQNLGLGHGPGHGPPYPVAHPNLI